ncbi:MAG: hypothetical protein OSJ65_04800 [Bacilli bacterium]|nr:hypothetical protein [Bacilli bacterium]
MNKKIIFITALIFMLVSLLIFKNVNYSTNEFKTLEQLKKDNIDTKKIYICEDFTDTNHTCRGEKLLKVIDDITIVRKIVELTNSFEEYKGDVLLNYKEKYSLYFVDENNKIINVADFGLQYILKTKNKEFYLNFEKSEELFKLIDLNV